MDPKSTALPLGHTRMMYEEEIIRRNFNPPSGLKAILFLSIAPIVYYTMRGALST
jgi:hypothetical protein